MKLTDVDLKSKYIGHEHVYKGFFWCLFSCHNCQRFLIHRLAWTRRCVVRLEAGFQCQERRCRACQRISSKLD